MSGFRSRILLLSGAVAVCALSAASPAFAGAFALREQSATGQGMSFAGMAAGGGDSLSGMFWNPAIVNEVENFATEQNVTFIAPSSKFSNVTSGDPFGNFSNTLGNGGDIGKNAILTAGYSAYRVTDSLAVGLSVNTPFGLATDPDTMSKGMFLARSARVRSFTATPTVGYQVNDWLSLGAGLQIQYFDIRLKAASPIPAASFASAQLSGDDVGVGFTAGVNIKPTDGTDIGIGFRSSIKHDLDGKFRITRVGIKQDIKADVKLPETVTAGIRQRVTEQLSLLGGVEWTNWSRLDTVAVRGGPPAPGALAFGYKDGWYFSGGAEYAFDPAVTVRAGVAYEKSPITSKTRTTRLPDDDRWWLSAGGTYNYNDRLSFDLGYSYVFVPGKSKIDIPATGGSPFSYSGDAKSDVHIVSVALRYKIGAETPAPLVTKY